MKYTFLLPAFKIRYLDEMLRSIQSQTYTSFKVIISDDCSPEDIYTVCEPYLSDSRFSYRRNEKNIGAEKLVNHWNMLVEMCDTEFLIMSSDDDVYAPTFLEEIDRLVKKYPDCDSFRSRVNEYNEKDGVILYDGPYQEYVTDIEFLKQQYNNTNIGCIANFVFRTSALKKKGGFVDFPFAWFSDDATVIMMAENGCANTPNVLFNFRVDNGSISYSKNSRVISYNKILSALKYDTWIHEYIKRYDNRLENAYVRRILSFFYFAQSDSLRFHINRDIYNCSWNDFHVLCKMMKKHYISLFLFKKKYYLGMFTRYFSRFSC